MHRQEFALRVTRTVPMVVLAMALVDVTDLVNLASLSTRHLKYAPPTHSLDHPFVRPTVRPDVVRLGQGHVINVTMDMV